MSTPHQRRSRLSIDILPELRRRIEAVAASRDLSVREYVEFVLMQVIASEENNGGHIARTERMSTPRLTEAEQQRGSRPSPNWSI